jgi:S1-C subfamily serine protease
VSSLTDLSNDIVAIVEGVGPSIVRVDARRGRPATGIVLEANLVLTADHVIEQEDAIQVQAGTSALKATVAGRDPETDLALLRTEKLAAPPIARGASSPVRIGELVLAVGRAGELQVTLGVVSGLSGGFRSWRAGETERLIQTTADLLPGFSGGPLLGSDGRLVGINSWNFSRGITRALPLETAQRIAESLKSHGRIRRAYLGLGAQPVRLADAAAAQAGQPTALLVITVEAGGPAQQAGLMQGDTVVAVDGTPVHQLDDLFNALRAMEVGSSHRLRVIRAGETRELSVTAGERQR